jgi:hypothetical protein
VRLRDAAGNGRGTAALDTLRYLFELDHPPPGDAGPERDDTMTEARE